MGLNKLDDYYELHNEINKKEELKNMTYDNLMSNNHVTKYDKLRLTITHGATSLTIPRKYGKVISDLINKHEPNQIIDLGKFCKYVQCVHFGTYKKTSEVQRYLGRKLSLYEFMDMSTTFKYSYSDIIELFENIIEMKVSSFINSN